MSTIATVMPYVAIGYAIYSMFSSKGGGPKVGGAYGLLGAPGIVGPDDNSMTSGLQTQAKSALDSFNKLVTQLGGHNPGLQFGIGISTDPRGTAPSFVQTQVTQDGQLVRNEVNTNVGRDNAAVAAEVARQLNESIIDALHRSGIDQEILGYFDQITAGADAAGKAAAISMLPQLAALKQAFSGMATVFPYLSQTSIQAKIAMTQLAGGIDQLSGLMGGFMATFFTAGEQMQIVSGQLQTQLATVGITADVMNMSMQQYRDMVMNLSTQTNTAAGQAAFVTSLQASAAFAQMKQQQQAEADRLKAEWEQQQAQAKAQADAAQAEYDRKLSTAQSNLQNAYQSQRDAIQKTIDSLKNWKQALSDLRDSLSTDSSLSPLTPTQQYAAAGTRLQELAIDARNGDTTAQGKFDQAARQFLALSRQQYASGEQYSRDFKMVSDMLDNLSASATSQISAAERQQQALDASVSVLLSIDKGVLSVDQAIRELINVKNSAPAPYVPPTAYNPNPAGSASAPTYTPPPPTAQTAAPAGSGAGVGTAPAAAPMNWTTWAAGIQNEPTGFAEGLDRVPKDGFYRLHAGEKVLNDKEAGIARQSPDLAKELAALREELASLRKENRQDAGSQISALFDAIQELAEKLGQATINSARTREYLSKPRSTLS